MTNTANLQLPLIDQNQSQKHVTHNAALQIIDALVDCVALGMDLTAPPASPADGQRWIVASGAMGAWLGKDGLIAAWQSGVWNFYTPSNGFLVWVVSKSAHYFWNGSSWLPLANIIGAGRTQVSDANYTALATDRTIAFISLTAARTVTLPAAASFAAGAPLLVIDESGACSATNTITINRAGTDTIDGAASAVIAAPYGFVLLESNTANKWTIAGQWTGSLGNLNALAVGTAPDPNNPLSVKLNSALFAAKSAGEGGTGDLRVTINKSAAANTASYLFQDNWSGRAEFGLTGDDNFHFKVSPDGASWTEALLIDKTSGLVTLNSVDINGGAIDGTNIGATTAGTGRFTTLTATGAVTLSPASANVAISPTGAGTVTISPAGALTINPTAASTINNCSIGATTASTGRFTTLTTTGAVTLSPANANVVLSPTGTGVVTISPATVGSIDNVNIGATTAGTGRFTTLTATTSITTPALTTGAASNMTLGTSGGTQLTIGHVASAVNNLQVAGSATGAGTATLSAIGTDTNIDIVLTPKGSGRMRLQTVANGTVATSLTSIGPTGANTTVQEWFVVKNASGVTRYIPAW